MQEGREGPAGRASVGGSPGPRQEGSKGGGVRGHRPPLTAAPPWGTARPTLAMCPAPYPDHTHRGAPRLLASPALNPPTSTGTAHRHKPRPSSANRSPLLDAGPAPRLVLPRESRRGPGAAPPRLALTPPPAGSPAPPGARAGDRGFPFRSGRRPPARRVRFRRRPGSVPAAAAERGAGPMEPRP